MLDATNFFCIYMEKCHFSDTKANIKDLVSIPIQIIVDNRDADKLRRRNADNLLCVCVCVVSNAI